MDFSFTPEQVEASALAATILAEGSTPERLRAVDDIGAERFDAHLWKALGDAGLLGLPLPEEYDGAGLGFLELCSVLVEAGRVVAPVPLASHVVAAMALARFGSDAVRKEWLPAAASGATVLATAVLRCGRDRQRGPVVTATQDGIGWRLDGASTLVIGGTLAGVFLVPVQTDAGVTVLLVTPDDAGVTVEPQRITDGDLAAQVTFDGTMLAGDRVLGDGDTVRFLDQHWSVALCALQLGVVEGALALTSSYAGTREQFGRPIGTFQAVSQRLADGYIDVLGARLMLWQAAWRLSEGLEAELETASAKLWAADAGHRIAHTTVHVHGGVGIDLDGEAHRYFSAAKRGEFLLGGATEQARVIGKALAAGG